MKTQIKKDDGTGTEAQETSGPAGVDLDSTNRHCYSAPLRLRGGGNDDESDMSQTGSTSGDMVAGNSKKRGPTSPGGQPTKQSRSSKKSSEISDLIGWIEHTIIQEKEKKRIGIQTAEKLLININKLRTATATLAHENSRLAGEVEGKDEALQQSLTIFIEKLDIKNAEASSLKIELDALKTTAAVPRPTVTQQSTYAAKAAKTPASTKATPKNAKAPPAKSKKAAEMEQLNKSRQVKATSRFIVEIPQDMSVADAKAGVWQAVRSRNSKSKAKTIVSGRSLIIIPDDSNYQEELTECLLAQNEELGLTAEDMSNSRPLHKLGPRDSDVVHWVVEVPPSVLAKIENKALYIGMTRCRCKLHSSLPQCYNCQQYGHTAKICEQTAPTCRRCAGAHDSRTCSNELIKCANCKGPHKASSAGCKAKSQAKRSLLRRTDFGQQ
ncbi:unnamed protein product [Macrosiphum euphorbiae]|uniref:CCHC-type domain-containing protein n=1 Tax=Macrosiphum euphorbiae TaxID=13131 RepID=A0AAV0XXW7_9HEMI|nr:unnamed protein product [Macrosiphum euphorbiae]